MSRGSSTTQRMEPSRRGSLQMVQRSPSATLKQRGQRVVCSLTATMASARRVASSGATFRMWKARRWADLGPMPGRRPSSSTSDCSETVYTASDFLGAGEGLLQALLGRETGAGGRRLGGQDGRIEELMVDLVRGRLGGRRRSARRIERQAGRGRDIGVGLLV